MRNWSLKLPTGDNLADLDLIVPNLHRRYSGVTATNRMVAPKLAKRLSAAWFGSNAPEGIARLGVVDLFKLWRRPRPLIRRMDAIIATSDVSASYLKRSATVIPHGVDTDLYAPPPDRAAAFAESGLPGRHAIGCFGRVRAQKGSDVFVEAMCRLLPRYPDFTAVMVGAIVPEQMVFANDLKRRIEAAGLSQRIVILGELEIAEVQRWYQRLTIYAFTSRNEGFGLTLIEAMAAGAALVAARAGAA